MADMINCKDEYNAKWLYDNEMDGFVIEAKEDIKKGEQVFDTYGEKANHDFLLSYGFLYFDKDGQNKKNYFPMPLFLSKDDKGLEIKREVFLYGATWYPGSENEYREFNLLEDLSGEVWDDFMSFARFVSYDGDLAILFDKHKRT